MSLLALFILVVTSALVVDMFSTPASVPLMPSDAWAGHLALAPSGARK